MFEISQFSSFQRKDGQDFRGFGTIQDIAIGKEEFDKCFVQNSSEVINGHGSHTSHSSK
jgi:hypothetical protein